MDEDLLEAGFYLEFDDGIGPRSTSKEIMNRISLLVRENGEMQESLINAQNYLTKQRDIYDKTVLPRLETCRSLLKRKYDDNIVDLVIRYRLLNVEKVNLNPSLSNEKFVDRIIKCLEIVEEIKLLNPAIESFIPTSLESEYLSEEGKILVKEYTSQRSHITKFEALTQDLTYLSTFLDQLEKDHRSDQLIKKLSTIRYKVGELNRKMDELDIKKDVLWCTKLREEKGIRCSYHNSYDYCDNALRVLKGDTYVGRVIIIGEECISPRPTEEHSYPRPTPSDETEKPGTRITNNDIIYSAIFGSISTYILSSYLDVWRTQINLLVVGGIVGLILVIKTYIPERYPEIRSKLGNIPFTSIIVFLIFAVDGLVVGSLGPVVGIIFPGIVGAMMGKSVIFAIVGLSIVVIYNIFYGFLVSIPIYAIPLFAALLVVFLFISMIIHGAKGK